jgi:hypothetical protein
MDYYSYTYPARVKTETRRVHHIVDHTPEKFKSKYISRSIDGRPSDAFYFRPTINVSKKEIEYEHQISKPNIIPGPNGTAIKEIYKTVSSPQKFNVNGIIREKYNYTLYENKNWTENVQYPVIEYEKVNLQKPKPKPKPKLVPQPPKVEKEFEVVREEIEREEEKKKKYMKSNYIRKDDEIRNKKYKYKFKKKKMNAKKFSNKKDNDNDNEYENNIFISNENNNKGDNNDDDNDKGIKKRDNEGSEIKKIKKTIEQKKISGEYNDLLTTKKEYKLYKTSVITSPMKNK